jgi:hypothetical protein
MFPVETESLAGMAIFGEPKVFSNSVQLADFVQSAIIDLETKLDVCENHLGEHWLTKMPWMIFTRQIEKEAPSG